MGAESVMGQVESPIGFDIAAAWDGQTPAVWHSARWYLCPDHQQAGLGAAYGNCPVRS